MSACNYFTNRSASSSKLTRFVSCEKLGRRVKCQEREERNEHGEETAETPGERGMLHRKNICAIGLPEES